MPDLVITYRQVKNVTILDLSGPILIGEGSTLLRETIRQLLHNGHKNILLNFSGVKEEYGLLFKTRSIDSSTIGELCSAYTGINCASGQLKLVNINSSLLRDFMITNLLKVFEVFNNEGEALASFPSDGALLTPLPHTSIHGPKSRQTNSGENNRNISEAKNNKYDVFLSYASSDKDIYVRPFAIGLSSAGISYWLDEAEIVWGDSITEKINQGLRTSRYVILFLSEDFIRRGWTNAELQAAINKQNAEGVKTILPLILGDRRKITNHYPLLRDLISLHWNDGIDEIINRMKTLLSESS